MVAKPAVYRKREKRGTKTTHFAASVTYNLGGGVGLRCGQLWCL